MPDYVSLHNHSSNSMLDGAMSVEQLVDVAASMDMKAVALTDHGFLYGLPELQRITRQKGIKGIFGCLLAGQPIITSEGVKSVETIEVGDSVLTHKGRYRSVLSTMTRKHEGDLYTIELQKGGETLQLTGEHPVLIRDSNGDVSWKKPGEIAFGVRTKGGGIKNWNSYVCFPKMGEKEPVFIDTLSYMPPKMEDLEGSVARIAASRGHELIYHWTSVPTQILLDEELAYFLGLYAAEGSVRNIRGHLNGLVNYSLGANEMEYAEAIQDFVDRRFGQAVTINDRTPDGRQSLEVYFTCRPLAYLFSGLCGIRSHKKRVPREVFESPAPVRRAFLKGLLDGDGKHDGASNPTGCKTLKVASRSLAWGMKQLIADEGYWAKVKKQTCVQKGTNCVGYTVAHTPKRTFAHSLEDEHYTYKPVKSITAERVSAPVFNFEVEEDNSYVSNFVLHNCELYFTPSVQKARDNQIRTRYHQLVLAKNDEGYKNLVRLASWAATEGFYHRPLIDFETLARFRDGLIVTSTCLQGIISRTILGETPETEGATQAVRLDKATEIARWFKDTFGDDFYLEAHRHSIEDEERVIIGVTEIGRRLGIDVTIANDCHYVEESDFNLQDALTCIGIRKTLSDPDRFQIAHRNLSFKSGKQMVELFPEFPNGADVTMAIADKCNAEIHFDGDKGVYHFPQFPVPEGVGSAHLYLMKMCADAFPSRYPNPDEETKQRVRHELAVIKKMGFSDYFLIVADLVRGAREMNVPVGPGRGSAAGSIVCYLLGITGIDPVEHGLLFERFLNSERVSLPDVDLDLSDEKRHLMFDYLRRRYGADRTSQISTSLNLKPRKGIQDFARVLGISQAEAIAVTKKFPDNPTLVGKRLSVIAQEAPDVAELIESYSEQSPEWKKVFEWTEKAHNFPRNRGLHAAALLITPGPVEDYVPVQRTRAAEASAETVSNMMTQYPGDLLDSFGLLKMDILGLETLSVIERTVELVESSGQTVDPVAAGMTLGNPFSDPLVYDLFQRGRTVGVFQFESAGMRQWLKKLKPTEFGDIVAMNALYRPGPMDLIPSYIKRKHGQEAVEYLHPSLEPVLAKTYGIPIYQESVMQMARVVGGYTLADADLLRRTMSKKKIAEMAAHRVKFRDGAVVLHGMTAALADEIFDQMETFSGYGQQCLPVALGFA